MLVMKTACKLPASTHFPWKKPPRTDALLKLRLPSLVSAKLKNQLGKTISARKPPHKTPLVHCLPLLHSETPVQRSSKNCTEVVHIHREQHFMTVANRTGQHFTSRVTGTLCLSFSTLLCERFLRILNDFG